MIARRTEEELLKLIDKLIFWFGLLSAEGHFKASKDEMICSNHYNLSRYLMLIQHDRLRGTIIYSVRNYISTSPSII